MTRTRLSLLALGLGACLATAQPAAAADPKFELGASLLAVTIITEDDGFTVVAVPSSPTPFATAGGLFASFFINPHVAIEPQLGLFAISDGDDTDYSAAIGAQVSYFLRPASGSSVYLLGGVGTIRMSNEGESPTTFSVGVGYRVPMTDSLAVRVDGRYTRYQVDDEGGNTVSFNVSLGGIFARR